MFNVVYIDLGDVRVCGHSGHIGSVVRKEGMVKEGECLLVVIVAQELDLSSVEVG